MPLILFLLFLVVPIIELAVIIQVGQIIGIFPTVLLLLTVSIIGAVLVRREGVRAWRKFREALSDLRLPTTEVVNGALVMLGGALMLTPGFVTDALGLLLVIPVTRPFFRRLITSRVRVATFGQPDRESAQRTGSNRIRGARTHTDPRRDPDVLDVEVVSIERNDLLGNDDEGAQ